MKFISSSPNTIELKYYGNSDYPFRLIWEYIGPNRNHGDSYYRDNFLWYEIFREATDNIAESLHSGEPVGIFCITENMHLSFSLHLSVLEILKKGNGDGTEVMKYLLNLAKDLDYKYFTLVPHDENVKQFYYKLGLSDHTINNFNLIGTIL